MARARRFPWVWRIDTAVVVGLVLVISIAAAKGKTRRAALAGSWYPADKIRLRTVLDRHYSSAEDARFDGRLFALIVPHADYVYSGDVAALAYRQVKQGSYDRVVLLGPSHSGGYRGFSTMNVAAYRMPLGDVPLDASVCRKLRAHKLHIQDDFAPRREHSLEVQLPFLQRRLGHFKLVPILVGALATGDAGAIAAAIKPHLNARTLVVVSSDFTHYGRRFQYAPFKDKLAKNIKRLDIQAAGLIIKKDFDSYAAYLKKTGVTICGRDSIAILLRLLPPRAGGMLLKYDTSGDMDGDYTSSISYVSIAFVVDGAAPSPAYLPKTKQSSFLNSIQAASQGLPLRMVSQPPP